jgi:hypothetical protein
MPSNPSQQPPTPLSPQEQFSLLISEIRQDKKELEEALQTFKKTENLDDLLKARKLKESIEEKLEKLKELKRDKETPADERDFSLEQIQKEYDTFLKKTFKIWGEAEHTLRTLSTIPTFIDPRLQDFESQRDIAPEKFGQYTVNPEMLGIDLESYPADKIKVLELPDMVSKPIAEVAEYIVDTYGATHRIPGLEMWKFILENLESKPDDIKQKYEFSKDDNHYFFFGSLVRASDDGRAFVPYVHWSATGWKRDAHSLSMRGWLSDDRVVLLEK